MKLKDVELLPGVVININDPKLVGRVKASVPTLFDTENGGMEEDGLPWIYPLTMAGQQHFSKLVKGSKIWVFKIEDNYQEFWYIPMVEYTKQSQNIINDYNNAEVLISRDLGENKVTVYYNDNDGIMINVGQNSLINITNDTTIKIKSGTGEINLKNNKVYIGDGAEGEPAVMGEQLFNLLSQLQNALQATATAASGFWATSTLAPGLTNAVNAISSNLANIKAQYTQVD